MVAAKVQFAKSATGANVTSISATLAATTAGNMLIAIVVIGGNQTPTPPTGWVKDLGPVSTETTPLTNIFIYHLANCAAGITSVAFTLTSNGANLSVWEFSGMPTTVAIDVSTSHANQTTTPIDTSTTGATTQAADLVIAGLTTHSGIALTWSGFTTGFTNESGPSSSGASNNPWTQPSYKLTTTTGSQTFSATPTTQNGGAGVIIAYKQATGTTISSGVVNMGNVDAGLSVIANQLVGSGIVKMGNVDAGLLPTGTSIIPSGVFSLGQSTPSGISIPVAPLSLVKSGIFTLGTSLPSGVLGDSTLSISSGLIRMGNPAPNGLVGNGTFIISSGLIVMGNNDTSGTGQHLISFGTSDVGGLLATGGVYIQSGLIVMGTYAGSAGIPPIFGHVGTPGGHWQYYALFIWRSGAWNLVTVKRWKSDTGTWKTL